jgi:putative protease
MQLVTFVSSEADILECAKNSLITEVLIETQLLARVGQLSLQQAREVAELAQANGLRPILVWDILMTEPVFQKTVASLEDQFLSKFAAVRVADLGAAYWLKQKGAPKIQLILEAGSHNLTAILGWEEYFGECLQSLIVSHELPEASLQLICKSVRSPVEILGAGRVELFYSPRPLLSQNFSPGANGLIEVTSASEDSHKREFPTVESAHGTMMYLHRDRFILQRWLILEQLGLAQLRVDLRHLSGPGRAAEGIGQLVQQIETGAEIKWPVASGQPFKHSNNTTRQFGRLRSKLAGRRGLRGCVAEVVASETECYTVYKVIRAASLVGPFRFEFTTGDELVLEKLSLRDLEDQPVSYCEEDQILLSPWVRKAGPGSLVFVEGVE